MNIGILGTGFGAYHAAILKKLDSVDRVVIFGRNEDKLHKLKEELGVEITSSIEDIMQDSRLDIIDICLPSPLHKKYTLEAMKAGKHVYCETPVVLSLEDATAMREAELQYGKRILVNQFIKFDPAYQYLYESARQEKYGKLLHVSVKRETPPLWGNLGLDTLPTNLMIHELDFITWLLGSTALSSVWGTNGGKEEQALVRVSFEESGVSAEVTVSSLMPDSYPFTVGYEAYFEQAKLVFHESDDMQGNIDTALYEYSKAGKQEIVLEKQDPYKQSLQHAIHCLQDCSESVLSLNQALQSMEIALNLKQRLTGSTD